MRRPRSATLRRGSVCVLAGVGVCLVVIPACSDVGTTNVATTVAEATAASTSTSTSTTVAPTTVPPTAPPMTPEELTAAVGATFQAVFAPGSNDPALVENGDAHAPTLDALRSRPNADTVVSLVATASMADADCSAAGVTTPCAVAIWTLTYKGHEVLADVTGHVVYLDGAWKVAERTWCTITQQSVPAPAGC